MIVKVTGIETRKDRQGNEYKNVQVESLGREIREVGGMRVSVKTKSKRFSFNAWKESYLDGSPDYGHDSQIGDNLIVERVKGNVQTPYEIDGNSVNSYTAIFPGEENPSTSQIVAAFKNAGHVYVDNDGVAHGESQTISTESEAQVPS